MGNIYKRKDGLKVMEVEYGWGMDMNAIEFPVDLAFIGIETIKKILSRGNEWPNGMFNIPMVMSLYSYCHDVIDNAKNGETTYILEDFWNEKVNYLREIIKKLEN